MEISRVTAPNSLVKRVGMRSDYAPYLVAVSLQKFEPFVGPPPLSKDIKHISSNVGPI